jgi:hypothetical protein
MRLNRDIATVAALQVVLFSILTHYEPQFFLLHLYQTIIYMAILILLFYLEDRRAYMIGMLAPVAWLGMVFATGLLGGAARQVMRLTRGEAVTLAAVSMGLRVVQLRRYRPAQPRFARYSVRSRQNAYAGTPPGSSGWQNGRYTCNPRRLPGSSQSC